ncbi:Peroxiredoxin [Alteribacillus persepolensis]|uniref:Peroxiredoxin n=1 Tax=Alteribacillus persepolensis TaxID=568899 RepID=A0A1G7ZQ19_9BACI|nr:TlpA disulfide reductase family protein [Alteribacillus persepolensis]SDH10647.1 Peroxiredoxin [Alteribacillus persepolensis]
MKQKHITITAVCIALVVIGYIVYSNFASENAGNEEGDTAIDFTLPSYNGEDLTLSSYEGNVVIMNMWASWCEPCTDEIPALIDFHHAYRNKGVVVLTINMNSYETDQKDAKQFVEEFNMTQTPAMIDEEGDIAEMYSIQYLPTTFIIDRDGTIARKVAGEVDFERLETIVQDYL